MTNLTSRLKSFADAVSTRISGEVAAINDKIDQYAEEHTSTTAASIATHKAAVAGDVKAINAEIDAIKFEADSTSATVSTIAQALAGIQKSLDAIQSSLSDPGDLAAAVAPAVVVPLTVTLSPAIAPVKPVSAAIAPNATPPAA
jgi:chromosome segregation ATPase